MKVTKGSIVRIDYEIRIKGGDVIESSAKSGSKQYTHGQGQMLPGLEKKLEGLGVGQEVRGELAASEVFETEEVFPTKAIPRKEFSEKDPPEVGTLFEAHTAEGGTVRLKVLSVTSEAVTVRLMPAIAGKDLTFRARVLTLEDPVTHKREIPAHKPPPPPAEALDVELEEES